jgi:hypothetical protein
MRGLRLGLGIARGRGGAPDTIAPTAISIVVSAQEADGDVPLTINGLDENSTAYWVLVPNGAAAPSATQVVAGQNGSGGAPSASGNFAVTVGGGPYNVDIPSGLNASLDLYVVFRDGAGNNSVVYSDLANTIDSTAPALSSPTGTQTGATTADGAVTSDTASGTLYAGVWPTASTPTAAEVVAGTGAIYHTSDATPTAGSNAFAATGLTASTAYKWHYVQDDAFANRSAVSSTTEFTTAAPAGLTLLTHSVDADAATTHTATATATAGETVVIVLTWSGNALSSVLVDPGGANLAATSRQNNITSSNGVALFDVVWPSTGALTIETTCSGSTTGMGFSILGAGSKTHQASQRNTSGGSNPEFHEESINTTSGQSVVMAVCFNHDVDPSSYINFSALVGTRHSLATGRRGFVAKNDSVSGGTPQAFRMTWTSASFLASNGLVGVYS